MSLPRTSNYLDSSMQPYAPDSKYMRANLPGYPGGTNYLTSEFLQDERYINKNVGRPTNGSVRTSVSTRSRDQNTINVNQLAFMDTEETDKPILLNLQTLNWWLVDVRGKGGHKLLNEPSHKSIEKFLIKSENGNILNLEDAQKSYIMERMKLYGVVVNRDVDNNVHDIPRERIARDFTCTVDGVCHVLDYWSHKGKILRPFDSCYFVLKKVLIKSDFSWQPSLTHGNFSGTMKADTSIHDEWCWQVVPAFCSDNALKVEDRTWLDDEGREHLGGLWEIGRIHENPDIGVPSMFEKRKDATTVARNITYLHDMGRVTPIHMYLKLGSGMN